MGATPTSPGLREPPLSPDQGQVGLSRPNVRSTSRQPFRDGGPRRVRPRVPPECDLLPAHLQGGLREAGGDLHGALAAPPLPQPRPQPGTGREGGARGQAGRVRAARAPFLSLGAGRRRGCGGVGWGPRGRVLSPPLPAVLESRVGLEVEGGAVGPGWVCQVKPEAAQLGECSSRRLTRPASSCPTSSAVIAGEVLLCNPGGAELLQQHGRPGDAPAAGAAEEEHPPRASLLPG